MRAVPQTAKALLGAVCNHVPRHSAADVSVASVGRCCQGRRRQRRVGECGRSCSVLPGGFASPYSGADPYSDSKSNTHSDADSNPDTNSNTDTDSDTNANSHSDADTNPDSHANASAHSHGHGSSAFFATRCHHRSRKLAALGCGQRLRRHARDRQ
jgi:hypothetical protein